MVWVWDQDLTPTEKLVLLAIADHADGDGICWPGMRKVSEKTGFARRTVIRAVESLEASGLIVVERRRTGAGRQTSNRYLLQVGRSVTVSPGAVADVTRRSDRGSPGEVTEDHTLNHSGEPPNETKPPTGDSGGFAFWRDTWRSTVGAGVTVLLVADLQTLGRKHGIDTVVAEIEEMARRGGRSVVTLKTRLEDRAAGRPWGKKPREGAQASASRPKCGVGGKPCPPGAGGHLKGCHYYAGEAP